MGTTHPGVDRWQRRPPHELQQDLDKKASQLRLELALAPEGPGSVETCTVEFGRDGPVRAIFLGRLEGKHNQRFIATSVDSSTIELVLAGEGIGAIGMVSTANG